MTRQDWLHLIDAVIGGANMAGVTFEGLRKDDRTGEFILYYNHGNVFRFTHDWHDEPYTTLSYRLTRELLAVIIPSRPPLFGSSLLSDT